MLFFIISFSILLVSYGYIGWRLISSSKIKAPWNLIFWGIIIICLFLPFIYMYLVMGGFSGSWINLMAWIAYISLGFFFFLFVLLITRDLVVICIKCLKKTHSILNDLIKSRKKHPDSINQERRLFLTNSINIASISFSGILIGYGFYEANHSPFVSPVTIPIDDLPDDLEGFRIVQISDTHIGPTIKKPEVIKIVEIANRLNADLIAFTGDLADGYVLNLHEDVLPLRDLSSRYGTFFITGNHEYYSDTESWLKEVERLGFYVLLNENKVINHGNSRILLAGVTDYRAGNFIPAHASNPKKAMSNAMSTDIKILLAHQPKSIFDSAGLGFDLQLSGHTHGGQIFPWNYLVKLTQPFVKGLHKFGDSWIYVNRGAGYWGPPIRIGAPPEITLLTLTNSANSLT